MSQSGRKVGKISLAEQDFLVENYRTMSFEEMGQQLNRSPEFCKKYVMEKGLFAEPTKEEKEDKARCILKLHELPYWPGVVACYSKEELTYFENIWYAMYKQLNEDVSFTEQLFIKNWVIADLEQVRLLSRQKQTFDDVDKLKAEIAQEEKIDPTPSNMTLNHKKSELNLRESALGTYITPLEKLQKEIKNYSDKIKSNRDQRRQKETSADTYWGYVSLLAEEKFKSEEAYRAELHNIAQQKAVEKLSEWHQYVDGSLDLPLLNSETYTKAMEKEKEDVENNNS